MRREVQRQKCQTKNVQYVKDVCLDSDQDKTRTKVQKQVVRFIQQQKKNNCTCPAEFILNAETKCNVTKLLWKPDNE